MAEVRMGQRKESLKKRRIDGKKDLTKEVPKEGSTKGKKDHRKVGPKKGKA